MTRLDRSICKECGSISFLEFDDNGNAKKWVCATGAHEYKPIGREFKIKVGDKAMDKLGPAAAIMRHYGEYVKHECCQ